MSADLEHFRGNHLKYHTEQCRLCERTDIGRTRDFEGGEQRLLDLPSCSFSIKDAGDEYRIVTKGIGYGFGVSI